MDRRESNLNEVQDVFAKTLRSKGVDPKTVGGVGMDAIFRGVRDDVNAGARAAYLMKLCGGILTALVKKGILTKEEAQDVVLTARRQAVE